jgi:transcription elongation factor GreB
VLTIVDRKPEANGRVYFGAWVTLEDESGARVVYQIVGPDETDSDGVTISCESPMGRALIGREVGDEVSVPRPKGAANYVIEAVCFEAPAK